MRAFRLLHDRLNAVFHLGQEPFVSPSGARLDELVNAVRKCPSGALGIGIGPARDTGLSDPQRAPQIEISKDGPYRITGNIELVDEDGVGIPQQAGASAEHFSLCRCGSSLNKPFCSGCTGRWNFMIRSRPPPPAHAVRVGWRLSRAAGLDSDLLQPIRAGRHAAGAAVCENVAGSSERVAAWLSEVFGGPPLYSQRYGGYQRMVSEHVGKQITPEQRARWASYMLRSARMPGFPLTRIPGRLCRLYRVGLAHRHGKFRGCAKPRPTCRCRNGGGFVTRRRARALPQRRG